jgi:hypothetical protein
MMTRRMSAGLLLVLAPLLVFCCSPEQDGPLPVAGGHSRAKAWVNGPKDRWPPIAMINHIEYEDAEFEVAGCGFLLDWEGEIYAVTAKHVLTFFKSEHMDTVHFRDSLKQWRMYPKGEPENSVLLGDLVNEDVDEPLKGVPPERDWLLFRVKERSMNIEPLKFRDTPLSPGEKVFIVGWRYTDEDCTQRIHEGEFEQSLAGAFLVSTETLADNTMPGLSGAPVIDSRGDVIGIMCQKSGKMEKPASTDYPRAILEGLAR